MKKITIALIALIVVFGAVYSVRAKDGEQERERIASPSEIKNYRDIIRRGKDLLGIRVREIEKILSPDQIKNFEDIRRVGNALWGRRKGEDKKPVLVRPEATACVSSAIDAKDVAVKAALTDMNTKALAAIDARNTCQKAALAKTAADEQRTAYKACAETYTKTVREAQKAMKASKETAWKTFKTSLKSCSVLQNTGENSSSGEIEIEDGEDSI